MSDIVAKMRIRMMAGSSDGRVAGIPNLSAAPHRDKVPMRGEPVWYADLKKLKVGDGVNTIAQLPFANQDYVDLSTAQAVGGKKTMAGGMAFPNNAALPVKNDMQYLLGIEAFNAADAGRVKYMDRSALFPPDLVYGASVTATLQYSAGGASYTLPANNGKDTYVLLTLAGNNPTGQAFAVTLKVDGTGMERGSTYVLVQNSMTPSTTFANISLGTAGATAFALHADFRTFEFKPGEWRAVTVRHCGGHAYATHSQSLNYAITHTP